MGYIETTNGTGEGLAVFIINIGTVVTARLKKRDLYDHYAKTSKKNLHEEQNS